mmetsp:Transcript_99014/g.154802  ORF Transcript_99014/g.154802 Transcript_99014/m.154802 type:complete len:134 (-) Transcript_99014:691-1092(-)
MAMVFNITKVARSIMANGAKISDTVWDPLIMQMATFIAESGKKVLLMATAFLLAPMGRGTMASGFKTGSMARERRHGQMARRSKVCMTMGTKWVLGSFTGAMARRMRGKCLATSLVEKANSAATMAAGMKGNG